MSGLSCLCEYSSDSEADETQLEAKRAILPTPDLSKVSIIAPETHADDPLQHGGRSRSFPHVRGNWATFVYLQYSEEDYLLELIEKLEKVVLTQNQSWERCSDLHISLSKTFTLSYHLITPFTSNLQKVVNNTDRFELAFSRIQVYCNEESTRTFIALAVDRYCYRYLLKLTKKVDEILVDYKLPKFYEDPSFHMSIFWVNGDKISEVTNILNELNIILCDNQHTDLIRKVCCKSGNKYFQYNLL